MLASHIAAAWFVGYNGQKVILQVEKYIFLHNYVCWMQYLQVGKCQTNYCVVTTYLLAAMYTFNTNNFCWHRWGSSLRVCAHPTLLLAPQWHQRKLFIENASKENLLVLFIVNIYVFGCYYNHAIQPVTTFNPASSNTYFVSPILYK